MCNSFKQGSMDTKKNINGIVLASVAKFEQICRISLESLLLISSMSLSTTKKLDHNTNW